MNNLTQNYIVIFMCIKDAIIFFSKIEPTKSFQTALIYFGLVQFYF